MALDRIVARGMPIPGNAKAATMPRPVPATMVPLRVVSVRLTGCPDNAVADAVNWERDCVTAADVE
jgi:hypothetical protein